MKSACVWFLCSLSGRQFVLQVDGSLETTVGLYRAAHHIAGTGDRTRRHTRAGRVPCFL